MSVCVCVLTCQEEVDRECFATPVAIGYLVSNETFALSIPQSIHGERGTDLLELVVFLCLICQDEVDQECSQRQLQ